MPILDEIVDGRTDLVFEYLAEGHAATSTDGHGVSLIRHCAYYGDVSAIKFLLANGESLASLGGNFDLNGAAFHGHWRLCRFLLDRGADPNIPLDDTGETPLHAATSKSGSPRHNLVLQVLLDFGADPNFATKPGVETGALFRKLGRRGRGECGVGLFVWHRLPS